MNHDAFLASLIEASFEVSRAAGYPELVIPRAYKARFCTNLDEHAGAVYFTMDDPQTHVGVTITNIVIEERLRRRGIGRRVVEMFCKISAPYGCAMTQVQNEAFAVACGFVKKEGLNPTNDFFWAGPDMSIRVWGFSEAPETYQALSTHCGDEDWVAFVPEGYLRMHNHPPDWLYASTFGACETEEFAVEGGTVYIGSHA